MHDAWSHSASDGVIDPISAERAMHRAASLVLEQLYPNETAGQFEAQFAVLTSHSGDGGAENAEALGQEVASRLIERSLADGSGRVWSPKQRPAEFPGIWQPTYPLFAANPTEGLAPFWRPWVQRPVDRYDPPDAPRPGSARHSAETSEVLQVAKALGSRSHRARASVARSARHPRGGGRRGRRFAPVGRHPLPLGQRGRPATRPVRRSRRHSQK